MPLAREVAKLVGEEDFRYVYVKGKDDERIKLGWGEMIVPKWCVPLHGNEQLLNFADIVYTGIRDTDLFESRAKLGKKTLYFSERWFKPFHGLPGWLRIFSPSYFKMSRRIVKWLNSDSNGFYLAAGPWAVRDMRLLGVRSDKIVPWGYFVAPSVYKDGCLSRKSTAGVLRLLWVGRMLDWKRIIDIVRAVKICVDAGLRISLDMYGRGPEAQKLKAAIEFLGLSSCATVNAPVSIEDVRKLMHTHDIYVLSSDANEGWGAVLCEALEEGMRVIGTYEAGSSATILPETNLYHAGDCKGLAKLIRGDIPFVGIGKWTAKGAAVRMLALCRK